MHKHITSVVILWIPLILQICTIRPAFESIFTGISTNSYKPFDYSVKRFSQESSTDNLGSQANNQNQSRIVFISRGPRRTDPLEKYLDDNIFGSGRHTSSITQLKQIERPIDGWGNNQNNPQYGMCNSVLNRHTKALYKNQNSQPIDSDFYPRQVSNALGQVKYPIKLNPNNVTMVFTIWGQFLDHDLSLTEVLQSDHMQIKIPNCDPYFDLQCKGNKKIPFKRSEYSHQVKYPRQQMNSITHWLDGSNVYGSEEEVSNRLRTFQQGKLKVSQNDMLPPKINDKHGLPDAGDIRVAQNLPLMSYHTIFVRQHNRMCNILLKKDASLNDEQLYRIARNYVTGLIQKITMDEFLPILLGYQKYQEFVGQYRGYNPEINPNIDNQFSTAVFRFGHSLLVQSFPLIDKYGQKVDEFKLHKIFFRPEMLTNQRFDLLFRGLTRTIAKQRDGTIIDDVRNLLIADPSERQILLDLYALNVQRARDHGIQKYNYLRKAYGLKPLKNFYQLTSDKERAKKLDEYYKGNINELDPWVGILNQDSLPGAVLGQLGANIAGKTFQKLRNGDRFWYQNAYPSGVVAQIKGTLFSEIIIRNTGIKQLQEDIFHYNPGNGNRKISIQ